MAFKDRTKYYFARKLEEMLEEMPFNKVKVSELCRRCETTHQTFYYHFRDIYELAAWICMNDGSEMWADPSEYSAESATEAYRIYERRKSFYWKIFNDPSQYNVGVYMREHLARVEKEALKAATGVDELPQEMVSLAEYNAYGMIGLLKDWILGKNTMTAEEFGAFQYKYIPEPLRRATNGEHFDISEYCGV